MLKKLIRDTEDIKRIQIKLPEIKIAKSAVKTVRDGVSPFGLL